MDIPPFAPSFRAVIHKAKLMKKSLKTSKMPCTFISDAMHLHLEDRIESGEEISQPEAVMMTSLELAL